MMPIVEGGDVVEGLGERVLGRVVFAPETLKPMGVALSPDGTRVYVTTGRGKTLDIAREGGEWKIVREQQTR